MHVTGNTVSGQPNVVTAGPGHDLIIADNTIDQVGGDGLAAITVAPLWEDGVACRLLLVIGNPGDREHLHRPGDLDPRGNHRRATATRRPGARCTTRCSSRATPSRRRRPPSAPIRTRSSATTPPPRSGGTRGAGGFRSVRSSPSPTDRSLSTRATTTHPERLGRTVQSHRLPRRRPVLRRWWRRGPRTHGRTGALPDELHRPLPHRDARCSRMRPTEPATSSPGR